MSHGFVHLSLHTEFSLADSLIRIKPLMKAVAKADMPAVAMTDQGNLFALVKFYRAAEAAGVKPIVGVDLLMENPEQPSLPFRLTLLCKDRDGYLNLNRLISISYTKGQHQGRPIVKFEWLQRYHLGLIAISGARHGEVGRAIMANKLELAREVMGRYAELFPDSLYIEIQRTGRAEEEDYLHQAVALASELNLPLVASNDVRFLREKDYEAHEVRVCISEGRILDDPRREKIYSPQQYLRTPEEMAELFRDIPEALENSVEIAKRCNVSLTFGENYLPDFPIPDGMSEGEYFRKLSREGLEDRLTFLYDRKADDFAERRRPYDERLEIELDVIIQMGFPGYFLIVADFIRWAKSHDIPVGPGRGSGAGSLVAYVLTITDLDPLEYELLFERFLNPERVSMPDFDIDFCMEGRDEVIDYVARHYGREKVSQIITYGTMAAKGVVRDVGRVMGHPYGFVDQISKLIPFQVGITLAEALEQEEDLRRRYNEDEEVGALIDMARKLEGLSRNAGKHAGGVVIAPTELTDFAPLYCDEAGENVVTQFDKNDVESVGLVKFDFLGLRTLTIIKWALANLKKAHGIEVDITTIDLEDRASYDLLKASKTTAVFQLESRGMKEMIANLQPDCFEDIIALVALYRPGPLGSGMVDNFINRKHGREKVSYPDPSYQHDSLQPILEPTYGIILYQEQVMQIAQVLAGYSLGGADLLRRAMGKKKPEEMAKQRAVFAEGAENNGIDADLAMKIFDLVEKFAGYGFNKSHSAAYALVSYQTAWLKTHHPSSFMAAVLSADMDNTDKVVTLIEECSDMEIKVIPPSVNHSQFKFTVLESDEIVYGLGAIKGVGEAAIEGIVAEREENGPYRDLFDFCARIDLRKANKRVLEGLVRSGALDKLGPSRASLMEALPRALKLADQTGKNQKNGMEDLFGFDQDLLNDSPATYLDLPEWGDNQRLGYEKETLGLYLTGHPINQWLPELKNFTSSRIVRLQPEKGRNVVAAGLIVALRTMTSKRGDKIAFFTIDDRSGRIEVALFGKEFAQFGHHLARDKIIVVEGEVSQNDYGVSLGASFLTDIDGARDRYATQLELQLQEPVSEEDLQQLADLLTPYCEGLVPVRIHYQSRVAEANLRCGDAWRIQPMDSLIQQLQRKLGPDQVRLYY